MFIGEEDRSLKKMDFRLFIEKAVIELPRVEIVAKPEVILAVLENKKAVRTDKVFTATDAWPPRRTNVKNFGRYRKNSFPTFQKVKLIASF